jgi:hypothetical protein
MPPEGRVAGNRRVAGRCGIENFTAEIVGAVGVDGANGKQKGRAQAEAFFPASQATALNLL